ncbi:MAG: hypothetical protein IPN65_05875 [Elusimicrobia bacterium]|nr:hypothetical protein [Elusimicrobiota bacterium]MBK7687419.1 hypothetical protein [Elusimicrobiota bacterium]MBK7687436.1 hypothetical protein [Elusimicrobiota bacterium]MBK8125649.1 hypothetical protein [Elusimicrobiota bacterium]MBK8125667.1 hypothetical protein [Elusimicrobiota bacterium]
MDGWTGTAGPSLRFAERETAARGAATKDARRPHALVDRWRLDVWRDG